MPKVSFGSRGSPSIAWVLTPPCSAFIAAVIYLIIHLTVEPMMKL